jgi:hypothetical protein
MESVPTGPCFLMVFCKDSGRQIWGRSNLADTEAENFEGQSYRS